MQKQPKQRCLRNFTRRKSGMKKLDGIKQCGLTAITADCFYVYLLIPYQCIDENLLTQPSPIFLVSESILGKAMLKAISLLLMKILMELDYDITTGFALNICSI